MRNGMAMGVVLGVCCVPALGQVTFQDGDFVDATWVVDTIGTGSVVGAQVVGVGNPGKARQVTNVLGDGSNTLIRGFHRFGTTQATTYEPLTQGPIASLEYALDYFPVGGPTGGQGVAFGLRQGQVTYFASSLAIGNTSAWQTHAASLTASDFARMDGLAGVPNFVNGARIRFGFMTYNSWNGTSTGFETVALYDNFSVRVVPAPAGAGLIGALGVVALRRRRK